MKKLYVDIETTGLSKYYHDITVIGAFDGKEVTQLVQGINLTGEDVENLFCGAKEIVTYNGSRFDMPFIKHKFPELEFECRHNDLMYEAWRKNLYGGLKFVEKQLGIERESELRGIDAVRLWKAYKTGKLNALNELLDYNKEDVVNLKKVEKILKKG